MYLGMVPSNHIIVVFETRRCFVVTYINWMDFEYYAFHCAAAGVMGGHWVTRVWVCLLVGLRSYITGR